MVTNLQACRVDCGPVSVVAVTITETASRMVRASLAAAEISLSDALGRGITVTEMAPMDGPIDASRETTAAFVGRALRGPLNEPVLVTGTGEFRRRFGGTWSRSSLGPAVQQFFEHGGRRLYVVRVANGARGAMVCLPAQGSALVLRASEPGSSERIRAAVDYDGIDPGNDELFNLTLQRLDPVSRLVIDQEIYRNASYRSDSRDFVGDLLQGSAIARLEAPLPLHRPEATAAAYVDQFQDGSDGGELTDYDIIGSKRAGTGLAALQGAAHFDLLYIPPPGRGRDPGPAAVLAAERCCRQRRAMLVIDPPAAWQDVRAAAAGIRELGYASPNVFGYFPRLRNRREPDAAPRAVGGAIAGLLCRLDRERGCWRDLGEDGFTLSRDLVAAVSLDDEDARLLERAGLNAVVAAAAGRCRVGGSVTTGGGCESSGELLRLPVRRLLLRMAVAIDDVTRPALFEAGDAGVGARLQSQVSAYLAGLAAEDALADEGYSVRCDVTGGRDGAVAGRRITVLLAFRPAGCQQPMTVTIQQTSAGCRVASTAFAPA